VEDPEVAEEVLLEIQDISEEVSDEIQTIAEIAGNEDLASQTIALTKITDRVNKRIKTSIDEV
jgi:hypothetical protein